MTTPVVPIPNQNLAKPSRIITVSKPPGYWKSIILDVLSVAAAALFGYCYHRYLSTGFPIWELLGVLLLFAILAALQMFLMKRIARRFLIIIAETLALLVFFRSDPWQVLAVAGIAMIAVLFWGYLSGRARVKGSIEVPFFGATSTTIGKFTTAMLIFMILAYVPKLDANSNAFVSPHGFRVFFDWAAGVVNNFYPTLPLNGSFQSFSEGIAAMELQNNPTFETLGPQQKADTVSSTAAGIASTFAKNGITVDPNASTSDAFYNVVTGMLNAWKDKSSQSFIIAWVVILFFVLRGIGIVFVWLAQFISLIFYEILLSSGFMRIAEEPQTKETLEF